MSDTEQIGAGVSQIAAMFDRAQAQNRGAFLPYYPIGFPTYDASLDAITAMAEVGVDGFEIGMPFSDPIADGPVIQEATQIALDNGMTMRKCLQAVSELRRRGVEQPMMMMGYLNPILAFGVDEFTRSARDAGANGLIIPDLPPEEAALVADACARAGLALIFFLAPTSNTERIELVAERANGFIYVVSLTGVTGTRTELPADLTDFIRRLRDQAGDTPLVLGFGISTPEHAQMVSNLTDGFIVGSALVRAGKESVEAVRSLAETLRRALD